MQQTNSLFKQMQLGASFLYRERKSPGIRVLFIVLAVVTFFMTALNHLNDHAWRLVYDRAALAFGADMVISSHQPISDAMIMQAKIHNLELLEVNTTLTMARAQEQFQMVSLKSVGPTYPLLGEAQIQTSDKSLQIVKTPPKPGTLWVEPRLLGQFGISVGDSIEIGQATFTVAAILKKEPDAEGALQLLAPRVVMALEDLEKTQVVQPGSRIRYAFWITGAKADINTFKQWAESLNDPNLRIQTVSSGRSPIQRVVRYTQSYLGLIIMLTVALAGLSISLATRLWVRERLQTFGIFRVLGATPSMLVRLILFGLGFWGIVVISAMVLLGTVASCSLIYWASSTLPVGTFSVYPKPLLLSFGVAFFVLMGFALPEIMLTRKLRPLAILREGDIKLPTLWVWYMGVSVACIAMLYLYVGNFYLTAILVSGFGWAGLLAYVFLWAAISLLARIRFNALSIKLAVKQLKYRETQSAAQVLSLTLGIMILVILNGIRGDFLGQWQASLPEDTPNHFLVNIPPSDVEPIRDFLTPKLTKPMIFYPIVRARVTHVKDVAVADMKKPLPEGLRRALNITWKEDLPEDNPILEGPDWHDGLKGKALISVEQGFARQINVGLEDTITLDVAGQAILGAVYNIREVKWESFKPNFYIIYPEGTIEDLPATYITSFYLDDTQEDVVVELTKNFPEVTIFDVDKIIEEVQVLLGLFVNGLQVLIGIVFVFAFLMLYVILVTSKMQRLYDAALIRLIGGSKPLLQKMILLEFIILSTITVMLGVMGGIWTLVELSRRLFDLNYQINWTQAFSMSVFAIIILVGFGYISLRALSRQSPLLLLKDN